MTLYRLMLRHALTSMNMIIVERGTVNEPTTIMPGRALGLPKRLQQSHKRAKAAVNMRNTRL